jgi:hypothetical protein
MIKTRALVFAPFFALSFTGSAACVVDVDDEELLEFDDDLEASESLSVEVAPQSAKKPKKKCHDPSKSYVSHDPAECALIHFICADGQVPFFDECGCGCQEGVAEACGPNTCAVGQVCCNASCGICTEPDGFCTQQACEPVPEG